MSKKDYMSDVAQVPCVLCTHLGLGDTPSCIHHIREGEGMAQRSSNYLTVALCKEHHQGSSGLHGLGTRGFETRYKLTELDLLAMTVEGVWRLLKNR